MMSMGFKSVPKRLRFIPLASLFACALSVLALGCDKKGEGAANAVSGKVTLENKPVSGNVVFVGTDNKEYLGLLDKDGKYSVTDLPQGDYKVGVRGMLAASPGGGAAPKGAGAMPDVGGGGGAAPPAKYADPNKSGLTFKRTSGKQEHDIVLTP